LSCRLIRRPVIECCRDRFNDGGADGLAQIYTSDISFVNLGGLPFAGRDATKRLRSSNDHTKGRSPLRCNSSHAHLSAVDGPQNPRAADQG
jgi:hypothetical protein